MCYSCRGGRKPIKPTIKSTTQSTATTTSKPTTVSRLGFKIVKS